MPDRRHIFGSTFHSDTLKLAGGGSLASADTPKALQRSRSPPDATRALTID